MAKDQGEADSRASCNPNVSTRNLQSPKDFAAFSQ